MGLIKAIAGNDRIARRRDLLSAPIADELTVMDIDTGRYFGMNGVAARIWALLEADRTMDALCADLMTAFDVDAETCRREVTAFVSEMAAQGLVSVDHVAAD